MDKEKEPNKIRDWMKLMLGLDILPQKFLDVLQRITGFEVSDFKFALFPTSNFNTNMIM